jgi:hypothetical protein
MLCANTVAVVVNRPQNIFWAVYQQITTNYYLFLGNLNEKI